MREMLFPRTGAFPNLLNCFRGQSLTATTRVRWVIAPDLLNQMRGTQRFGKHASTEIHAAQLVKGSGRHHRAHSSVVAQNHSVADSQSFQCTARLGKDDVVLWQNRFRVLHGCFHAKAHNVEGQARLPACFSYRRQLRCRVSIIAEHQRTSRRRGERWSA